MFDLSLYLVTDRSLSMGRELEWIVEEAAKGGVTMVQLREKDCSTRAFVNLALKVKQRLKPYGVPLVINDRIDIALAVDADGLHIGQSDMPFDIARKLLGRNKIIGLSVESIQQVYHANSLDVDYIGISPVFSTPTKTDTAIPFGIDGVKEVMKITKHPAVAIGGINTSNARLVIETGVNGIAVVSAICSAVKPYEGAKELSLLVKR